MTTTLLNQSEIDAITLTYMVKGQAKTLMESVLYNKSLAINSDDSLSQDDLFFALSAIYSNLETLAVLVENGESKILSQLRLKTPTSTAHESPRLRETTP